VNRSFHSWGHVKGYASIGRENDCRPLFFFFYYYFPHLAKQRPFCQDRLGTNTSKRIRRQDDDGIISEFWRSISAGPAECPNGGCDSTGPRVPRPLASENFYSDDNSRITLGKKKTSFHCALFHAKYRTFTKTGSGQT
jgi:hypothetical protein